MEREKFFLKFIEKTEEKPEKKLEQKELLEINPEKLSQQEKGFLGKFRGKAKNVARVLTFITALGVGESLLRAQTIPPAEAAFRQVSLVKEKMPHEKVTKYINFFQHKAVELDEQYKEKTNEFVQNWSELYYKFENVFLNELSSEQKSRFELELKNIEDRFIDIYFAKTTGENSIDINNHEDVEQFKSLESFGDIVYKTPTTEQKENTLNIEIIFLGQHHAGPEDYRSKHSQELIAKALNNLIENNGYKFVGTEKQEATPEAIRKKEKLLKELSMKSELTQQEQRLKQALEHVLFLAPVRVVKEDNKGVVIKNVDPEYNLGGEKWREIHGEQDEITYRFFKLVEAVFHNSELRQELIERDKEFSEKVVKSLERRGREALDNSLKEIILTGENKGAVVFGLGDAVFFKSEAQKLNQDSKDFVQRIKDELGEDYFRNKYGRDIEEIDLNFYVFNPRIPSKSN